MRADAGRRPGARAPRAALGPLVFFLLFGALFVLPFAGRRIVASSAPDLTAHLSGIVEARNALREGQFPVRVAPTLLEGQRYPLFQFYATFPYTLGAAFMLLGANPYLAWKLVTLSTVALAGFYTYRCALRLTGQAWPSVVAGAVFVTAPYLSTDVRARFAYPESVSFCLLPAVLYYSWRAFASRRHAAGPVVLGGVSWCLVALSHNITYLYASLLVALFFLSCVGLRPRKDVPRLLRAGACYGLGLALALWYFVPQLRVLSTLTISHGGGTPADSAVYVPLRVLLSPTITTVPAAVGTPNLGLQIGWPILAAVGLSAYQLLRRGGGPPAPRRDLQKAVLARLVAAWAVAAFAVWSPVDFWQFVPRLFYNVQFTYRLLMFVVLWGSLIGALGLALSFRRRPGGVPPSAARWALLFVAVAAAPFALWWFRRLDRSALRDIVRRPDVGGQAVSNFRPLVGALDAYRLQAPPGVPVIPRSQARRDTTYGRVTTYSSDLPGPAAVQLPVLFYPHLLDVRVKGRPAPYGHLDGFVAVELAPGPQRVRIRFVGVRWATYVSAAAALGVGAAGATWAVKQSRRQRTRSRARATAGAPAASRARPATFSIPAAASAFALVAVPIGLAAAYRPAGLALHRRSIGRVSASSEADPVVLKAANAFDLDPETAWAALGGGPAVMTIERPGPRRVRRIVLEPRQTVLLEGWHDVGVVLYLRDGKVAEQAFSLPDAARQTVQELKLGAPHRADRVELHFSRPITQTLAGGNVDAGAVNPGYREIRVYSD